MKIAVISDIHGNTLAYDAVLADIKIKCCKKVLCLGDYMLAGYDPNGIVQRIEKLQTTHDAEIIQGNTDLMLTHPRVDGFDKIYVIAPCMAFAYRNDLEIIKPSYMDFIGLFPTHKEITIEGIKIFMCHGSPRRVDENITDDLSDEQVEEIIQDTDADLILCGHTHVPCGYQLASGQTVVNVGSVGRPMTLEKEACYAVVDINPATKEYTVEHVFVPYDNKLAAQKIRERGLHDCETLAKMLEG